MQFLLRFFLQRYHCFLLLGVLKGKKDKTCYFFVFYVPDTISNSYVNTLHTYYECI